MLNKNLEGYVVSSEDDNHTDAYLVLFDKVDRLVVVGLAYACPLLLPKSTVKQKEKADATVLQFTVHKLSRTSWQAEMKRVQDMLDNLSQVPNFVKNWKESFLGMPIVSMFAGYKSNAELVADNPGFDPEKDWFDEKNSLTPSVTGV